MGYVNVAATPAKAFTIARNDLRVAPGHGSILSSYAVLVRLDATVGLSTIRTMLSQRAFMFDHGSSLKISLSSTTGSGDYLLPMEE